MTRGRDDRRSLWSDRRGRNIQKTPSLSPSSACSPSRPRSPAPRNSLGERRGVIELTRVWQISGLTGKARERFRLHPTHAPIFHDTSSTKREGSEAWEEVVTSASRVVSNRPPNRTETELSRNRSVEDGELVRRETEFGDDEQSDGDEERNLPSKGREVNCEEGRGGDLKGGKGTNDDGKPDSSFRLSDGLSIVPPQDSVSPRETRRER